MDWDDLGRVFARPVELEPGFAPYCIHLFDCAVIQGDIATARRVLEELKPLSAARQEALELAYGLILGDSTQQAAAAVPDAGDNALTHTHPDLPKVEEARAALEDLLAG